MAINESDMEMWENMFETSSRKLMVIQDGMKKLIDVDIHFDRPVLGKIVVLRRNQAEQFKYDKPWACISVSDPNSPPAKINNSNTLFLHFDDVSYNETDMVPIQKDHAKQILEFAKKVWDSVDLLMIHCNAGLCRSPAIAQVLSEIYQPEQSQYFPQLYLPNKLVLSTLREVLNEQN